MLVVGIHKGEVKTTINGLRGDANIGRLMTPELVEILKRAAGKMRGANMFKAELSPR